MESTTVIKLQSLEPYRHLFPKALAIDSTIKKGAGVSDTVAFIPKVVAKCRWQVEKYVDAELRGLSTYEACEKLWYFVKHHIAYEKDVRGIEQVRSPRRLISDAKGDCDCFTTFIDACLSVLNIPITNRITKYKENFFQHIYPIVPIGNGNYITMDCVVDNFNYEEPYTEKKDYKMDLQFLDGIDAEKLSGNVDAQDLFGWEDEIGDLGKGKIFRKNTNTSAMPQGNQGGQGKKKGFQKFKTIAKRTLNVANKANPATALLRAGILASMKLNVMKVAQRLKWAYLSEQEAQQKGADMSKYDRLKKVLYKIEQIFYTAGGRPDNLKKAILTGRGNRNKEVNGLGYTQDYESNVSGMSEYTNLSTLLGTNLYHDEFVSGLEGTEGLGAVATSAAIASATTVMGTIAALLKSIGNLFPNKKGNSDFKDVDNSSTESSSDSEQSESTITTTTESSSSENSTNPTTSSNNNTSSDNSSASSTNETESSSNSTDGNTALPTNKQSSEVSTNDENENSTSARGTANKDASTTDPKTENKKTGGFKEFWEKNKKWMKPVGIGLGTATVLYLGYRALKKSKGSAPAKKSQSALNGMGRKKRKTKAKGKSTTTKAMKQNIALM